VASWLVLSAVTGLYFFPFFPESTKAANRSRGTTIHKIGLKLLAGRIRAFTGFSLLPLLRPAEGNNRPCPHWTISLRIIYIHPFEVSSAHTAAHYYRYIYNIEENRIENERKIFSFSFFFSPFACAELTIHPPRGAAY
jgi:hypothetical protein